MTSASFFVLIISTALLLGNEFSIGFFVHPTLTRAGHRTYLPAIQVFARCFGKIMPIWMAATLLLHIVLLWLTWRWPAAQTVFLLLAVILWTIIILFSVIGPVPINNRVKMWDVSHLPPDWEIQRRRWDTLNAIRVFLIGLAFVFLLVSFRTLDPIS
jgi:MFS superfamily sulfate permease-like transporter